MVMKMRPIDADALLKALSGGTGSFDIDKIRRLITKQPTIPPDAPRVMTLDEVKKCSMCWLDDDAMLAPALFIGMERRANGTKSDVFLVNAQDSDDCEFWYDLDDYGVKWRCWTARPTKEQMEAVKWDENRRMEE